MATIECRASGTAAVELVPGLRELLLGLSGFPTRTVRQHETVLKGPVQDRAAPEIRVVQDLSAKSNGVAAGAVADWEPRY